MFGKIITEAIQKFFESPRGESLIGNIMLKAVSQSLTRTIQLEDGKTEPGKKVVRNETVNLLDFMARYLPAVEASIRGVQVDAGQARNRSQQTLNEIGEFKQIFAEELERRNKIDSQIIAKSLILSKSHTLQQMSLEDVKNINNKNTALISDSNG